MARNKLEKMGLLKIAAVVMIAGTVVFTFGACGKKEAPSESVNIEQTADIATEDKDVAEVNLIENADDIGIGTESEVAETYKVEFEYCQNEDIEAKVDEKVTIPVYEDTVLMDTYYSEEYFTIADDAEYAKNFETISAEKHEDGSATIIAKAITTETTDGMVTRYSYDGTDMKAILCYQPYGVEVEAEDFGLNFVIEKDVEGNYEIVGLQDLAGNDCSDIIFYYGDVIGWSLTENATECDFEFGDEIYLSQDLVLYPVVKDMVDPEIQLVDQNAGLWIKSFKGNVVQYSKTVKGSKSENSWYSSKGKVVNEDGSKEYNPESGEVEESGAIEESKKPQETTTPKQQTTPTQPQTPTPTPTDADGTTYGAENNPWGVPGDCEGGGNFSSGDYSDVPRF